tara:strand:+ start:487 stop:681 length:195 start_codon:yes stop_codon:yes gene_type:complete
MSIENKIERLVNTLEECLGDAQKIDQRSYGWKAACPRVRKNLLNVARECGELRKEVQEIKNSEG